MPDTEIPHDAPPSAAQLAYEEIQRLIVIGELQPYELLSEVDLSRRTGCGRTPVRESLQRLKFEGFVVVLPRRGIMVTPVDINRQLELLEMRRPLEVLMVTLGAERASETQREEMLLLADELESVVAHRDRNRYLEINAKTHRLEAASAQNRFLSQQIEIVHSLSRRFWYSVISESESFSKAAMHHARVLRAMAKRDKQAAKEASLALLDMLEDASREAIAHRDG